MEYKSKKIKGSKEEFFTYKPKFPKNKKETKISIIKITRLINYQN